MSTNANAAKPGAVTYQRIDKKLGLPGRFISGVAVDPANPFHVFVSYSGYSAYVAAKGAISSLTRQWATEWAQHGIRVNAIMPTFVDTPQVASLLADPAFKAGIVGRIPLGRIGETKDLVGPAIFLCSDAASFVTGQILGIDGGLTATQ